MSFSIIQQFLHYSQYFLEFQYKHLEQFLISNKSVLQNAITSTFNTSVQNFYIPFIPVLNKEGTKKILPNIFNNKSK